MIKFYSGGVKRRKIVGKTEKIQVDRVSEKTYQFRREKTRNMRYKRRFYINF